MVLEIEQRRIVPSQRLPKASVLGELGPAMAMQSDGKASTVYCTYIRNNKPGIIPRKLLNLSMTSQLVDDFVAVNSLPTWRTHRNFSPIRVEYDELGKPRLEIGKFMGMAVSFSRVSDMLWEALSGPGNHLGMDVARAEEFEGNYPSHRAFHPEELCSSMLDVHGIQESAAMLWSVKEAAVKALGVGFGLLGPLDIRIESLEDRITHYIPRIFIAYGSLRRIGLHSSPCMNIISFNHAGTWASVAIRPHDGDIVLTSPISIS
jgi:hypothetical protein